MSLFRRISRSQLVRGSLLVFIGNNIASFGNFLYNLFMARLLGPEEYANLGAILSLFVLIGTPMAILSLLTVKTVSSYWGKKAYSQLLNFLKYFRLHLFLIGLGMTIVLLMGSPLLSQFLHIDSSLPILIVAASFVLSGPGTLNRATLQGTLSFPYLAMNSFVEITLKLILSIFLVILNFGLIGALLGSTIAGLIVYFLTLLEIKIIFKGVRASLDSVEKLRITDHFKPIFFATLTLTSFFTLDVILSRHFFEANISGQYVALATVGRIIYYVVGPVIAVMFPIISSRASRGTSYILPLLGTLAISLGLSTLIIFAYFLFPKLIIGILFGSRYYGIIPYLGHFSFFIAIYAVNSILTYFLLSISYYRPIYFLFFTSLLQGILIIFFHNSISEVIWVNIVSSLIYLLTASFFVWKKEGGEIGRLFFKIGLRGIYGG